MGPDLPRTLFKHKKRKAFPPLILQLHLQKECYVKNGGQGPRYTYLEVYAVSFHGHSLHFLTVPGCDAVTCYGYWGHFYLSCDFLQPGCCSTQTKWYLFLGDQANLYARCFGDKGDVEDITEGMNCSFGPVNDIRHLIICLLYSIKAC